MDSPGEGTYLAGTEEPRFLGAGRSCDGRFGAHSSRAGLPGKVGFVLLPANGRGKSNSTRK